MEIANFFHFATPYIPKLNLEIRKQTFQHLEDFQFHGASLIQQHSNDL